jgi:hypothetical protein
VVGGKTVFSKETKMVLRKNGWTQERKIDITKIVKYLEKEGYVVFEIVRDFLSQFGGMHFEIPIIGLPVMEKFNFDAIEAASGIYIELVKTYEECTAERMIPVGENNFHYTFFMSESGKMYAGFDDILVFLGNNYEDALEVLCLQLNKPEIPIIKKNQQ